MGVGYFGHVLRITDYTLLSLNYAIGDRVCQMFEGQTSALLDIN